MKKIFIAVICVILTVSLCGCNLLFPTDEELKKADADIGGREKYATEIHIIYPSDEEVIDVEFFSSKNITPKQIEGKVLVGYYGQNSAEGMRYFDCKGEMNGTWRKEYPQNIYAVYEDIDYEEEYKSNIGRHEEPANYYLAGYTLRFKEFPIDDSFYPILYAYPDNDIVITVHADIKRMGDYETDTTVYFGIGQDRFQEQDFASEPYSYTHVSLSQRIKARQLLTSGVYVNFVWHNSRVGSNGLVKNVYYTVSLVKP